LLDVFVKFVEEMGVNADAGGDDEVASLRFALHIQVLDAAECYAARCGVKGGRGRGDDIHGQSQVVGERVGRTHGQDRERDLSVHQHLDNVVNGAVTTAGKDGVAAREDGLPRLFLGMSAGMSKDEIGFDACIAQQSEHGFQFRLAPLASAGIRVVEQSCLAHSLAEGGLYLSGFSLLMNTWQGVWVWNKLWQLGNGRVAPSRPRPPP
jgi:hypothetical protein